MDKESLDQLLALDNKRMAFIQEIVQESKSRVDGFTDDVLLRSYLTYKIGATILLAVLECIDQELFVADVTNIAGVPDTGIQFTEGM